MPVRHAARLIVKEVRREVKIGKLETDVDKDKSRQGKVDNSQSVILAMRVQQVQRREKPSGNF